MTDPEKEGQWRPWFKIVATVAVIPLYRDSQFVVVAVHRSADFCFTLNKSEKIPKKSRVLENARKSYFFH